MDGEQFYQLVGAISRVMPEQKILFANGVDVESIVVLSEGDCGVDVESTYGKRSI